MRAAHDVHLGEQGRLFQVAVGDSSVRVRARDDLGLDVRRERVSPYMARSRVVEVDPSHAGLACVCGSEQGGFLGHYFGQVRGAPAQVGTQPFEGVKAVAHWVGDAYAVFACLVEGPLQGAE